MSEENKAQPVAWILPNGKLLHAENVTHFGLENEQGEFKTYPTTWKPLYTSAPTIPKCTCGDAGALGIVHRNDGPCFHYVECAPTIPEERVISYAGESGGLRLYHEGYDEGWNDCRNAMLAARSKA